MRESGKEFNRNAAGKAWTFRRRDGWNKAGVQGTSNVSTKVSLCHWPGPVRSHHRLLGLGVQQKDENSPCIKPSLVPLQSVSTSLTEDTKLDQSVLMQSPTCTVFVCLFLCCCFFHNGIHVLQQSTSGLPFR